MNSAMYFIGRKKKYTREYMQLIYRIPTFTLLFL